MKCEMLDSFGIWVYVELQDDGFEFLYNYDESKNIQIWKGINGEIFILRNLNSKIKK